MGDKYDGSLAGRRVPYNPSVSEAVESLALHETLVVKNEEGSTSLLRAVQNSKAGGLMLVAEDDESSPWAMTNAIKRSQMTSMLTDDARCAKYKEALQRALRLHPHASVVDIGSGTGLLAMFAAKEGAKRVTAYEMFAPLVDIARQLVQRNKLDDQINLIHAASTEVFPTESEHLQGSSSSPSADILVTEIFDSALLGENCVSAINHAHAHLLKKGAIIIPAMARLYGVVIHGEFWSSFRNLGKDFPLHRDDRGTSCMGGSVGIPVHFDMLPEEIRSQYLSVPFEVFSFDFTQPIKSRYRQVSKKLPRIRDGKPHAVLTWWEIYLTEDRDIVYSTNPGAENWQDHWVQVIYPFSEANSCEETGDLYLTMEHDECSFSFSVGQNIEPSVICSCGFHSIMTPYRIHDVASTERLDRLSKKIESSVTRLLALQMNESKKSLRCIDVSDNSMCAVLASRIESPSSLEIFSVEEDNEISSFLFSQIATRTASSGNAVYVEYDPLSAFIARESEKHEKSETDGFDLIMSEPFTRAMHAYPVATLGNLIVQRSSLSALLKKSFEMVPRFGRICAQLISFPPNTLQRSFLATNNVLGLDYEPYASVMKDVDGFRASQRISIPLFQYSAKRCSTKVYVNTVDFCQTDEEFLPRRTTSWIGLNTAVDGDANIDVDAVSVWVEYDGETVSSTQRSELVWLDKGERLELNQQQGLSLWCSFDVETGTWDIGVQESNS